MPIACHGEGDQAARSEAGALARGVQVLRDAPNDAKRPFLSALEALPCSAADRCDLKKGCDAAYSLQVQAWDAIAAVRAATRDSTAVVPPEAALLLSRSSADLARASALAKECADLEGAARRRYAL